MPIIKSAKKRVRVSQKATIRNAKTRRSIRETVKEFHKSLTAGKKTDAQAAHLKAVSAIDTAAKKNVIHKNKAARKKSQLSAAAKAAGIPHPVAAKKTTTKKPVAKKPATKKVAAPKKASAEKPATKK